MESLAVVESDPETVAAAIKSAALYDGGDTDQEMFVRLDDDCVETPASAAGAQRGSYCSMNPEIFTRLSVPGVDSVNALFDVDTVLNWLDWFASGRLTIGFEGQGGITSRLVLASGDTQVSIDCVDDPAVLNSVEMVLPDRFDGTTFLDDGDPVPTHIETTAGELSRLVDAVEFADAHETYPLTVRDGRLVVAVDGETTSVSAPLAANVDGPAVSNHYGDDFARVVRGIEGDVTLQTGPDNAVAFVKDGPAYTLRFVVKPVAETE